jgi:hypothetical protein
MEDGTAGQPESEVVAPVETGAPEVETTSGSLLGGNETELGEQGLPVDDDEEIEHDGEKFKVPKKLKDAFLRQDDYTRKTQAVAEERRQVEARDAQIRQHFEQRQAQFQAQAEFQQKHIKDVAAVVSIDERLGQLSRIDWDALETADPMQAVKLNRQVQQLQLQKQDIVGRLNQAQQQQAFERQQLTARQQEEIARREETSRRELEVAIKGFSTPEVQTQLKEAARSIGYRDEELTTVNDPRFVKLLNKAAQYDRLVAQRTSKPKEEPAKPVTRIATKTSPATVDEDKLSPDEWRKWRDNQVAQRNKR